MREQDNSESIPARKAAAILGMSVKSFHAYWPEHDLLREAAFVPPGRTQRRFIRSKVIEHRELGR